DSMHKDTGMTQKHRAEDCCPHELGSIWCKFIQERVDGLNLEQQEVRKSGNAERLADSLFLTPR
ncbi:MAG: hypothetical protein ACKO6N_18150, partial [Myxococcota bacterium]